jgi:hypothetical protein
MDKGSSFSKYTWIGAAAIMVGFFEGLGTDLYHYVTSFQGFTFSPYVIPAVLGIAGFGLIFYDFISKRRERKRRDDEENRRFFPANATN